MGIGRVFTGLVGGHIFGVFIGGIPRRNYLNVHIFSKAT